MSSDSVINNSVLALARMTALLLRSIFSVALSMGSRPPDVIRHHVFVKPGLSSGQAPRLSSLLTGWLYCLLKEYTI